MEQRYSSRCELCRNTRVSPASEYMGRGRMECPWCRAVRLRYGSYSYPIDDTNRHLFESPKPKPRPPWSDCGAPTR